MATASSSSSSSSLSCCAIPQWEYDVFLSFRGEDTRAGFVSHLHSALCSSGVRVFIDYELERGEKIDSLLESKIESSRIAIVVFSPKFADSTWCLQELTKILEMKHSRGQLVQPVFFHVDPSDVRKQTGVFAEIMARHEEVFGDSSETVKKWKDALSEVAKLSGWHLGNGLESDLIQKIVEEVSSKLHRPYLDVAKHPVALDKNIQAVRMLLHPEDDSVRVVGIYGIGGIGKTAIAKAIYKMIDDQFEGSSFLANIREISRWHGLQKLQEALLRDIMGDKTTKVGYIQIGADLIRQKLCNKRVLLVLDDVGSMDQLRDLMGERSWLGHGSRIILTTRDEQVLVAYGAEIYEVGELNHDDALQLFSWNAFQEPSPTKVYPYPLLSDRFTHCAKGVPLALIVLGSFLCGKSTHEWERTLNRLSATPGDQIDEILKISFDGLETHEQAIFLDIACFFNGEDKIKVIKAFDRCNFYPDSGLQILSQKSLIYTESSKIWMHDLLQEMGREIVRQESPKNPGRRSRLWSYEDILRVLQENLGTNSIQGIKLDKLEPGEVMSMGAKSMEQMKRLRLLMFHDKHLSGCPEYLWNDIRWLWGQGNNLPTTVESYGLAQPSIHGSNPTNPAKNEKHHGPIKTILFRFRCRGAASKIWKINCKDALSNFKCIVATPHKLAQFLCLRRSKRGSDSDMPSEEYSVYHCKINCRIALSDVRRVMATVRKLTQFSCFRSCKGSSHNNGIADFDSNLLLEEYSVFKKFSKAQLVRATKNFRNEIGGGSAGLVYRGILEDGQVVAIKWTNVTDKGTRDYMFISEIKTLRHVNHKNVIRLLGFHARRNECALVYEYMCNSSLDNHLHTIGSSTLMFWNARLKVALDVARGIEYLHEFASPWIVHRDIKSSNILLDENWTAKVSDFGFSISLPKGKDYFEDSVVGSIAYLDLEYLCTRRVTTKSDVYSYGIVLLELLSGRKAFQRDKEGPERYIRGNVVPRILQGQIAQALDPKMPIPTPFEMIAVANMAYLAVDCVQECAIDRPSMSYVVDRLRNALAQFPSELCDNTETSRSCKLSPYPSLSCDNIDVYASHNSSLMLEEEITREIT